MKEKTRLKLAARGMGPLVRPGRPGRGRRGVLAPERVMEVSDGVAGPAAAEAQPAVSEVPGYGEVLGPPDGSVRQRVRLRPAVSQALDVEAERLGMTREALCRFVLEEIARKAAEAPVAAVADADDARSIPAGYVGGAGAEAEEALPPAGDPVEPGGDGGADAAAGPVPDPDPRSERALLPPGRCLAGDGPPVRTPRRVRRVRRFSGRGRVHGGRAAALALALLAVLAAAAVVASWRYEVAGTVGDGVYVVDRWRGAVWRCGEAGVGRPPACAQAVFREPSPGGEAARFGRVVR
ncbi:MAG: hypothetical protein OXG04_18680 [Acidobacteria bacterium]|nr:hypothetical protein [Acidobacteriota bacterium]